MAGPSRKRAIDLDDDVQITGSQTRKNPRLTDVPIGRGPDDDEWDESALEEVVDPSQEYNDRAFIQYMLYGICDSLNRKDAR